MIETCYRIDTCTVKIDPANVRVPEEMELKLLDNGDICLGNRAVSVIGEADYERIKEALQNGNYRLTFTESGGITVEIL